MQRILETEWIDQLPADDPGAKGSRRDMLRLNRAMGHAAAVRRELSRAHDSGARTLADLGAGDGRFLLHVARQLAGAGVRFDGVLLDFLHTVESETVAEFQQVGWRMRPVAGDVIEWLGEGSDRGTGVLMATLFLHHLTGAQLERLFALMAGATGRFIACEPRRSRLAGWMAGCVRVIGCNAVTGHDAPVSVRAGFAGRELSELWPRDAGSGWTLEERRLGLFSHLFIARREVPLH